MKQKIDDHNDSLPKYNSENSSNWVENFIAKTLFDSKIGQEQINSYDEYIKKIISSSEFNYETDGEKKLSIASYFIPIFGEYKMVAEIVSGRDLVSGRKFSIEEQLVATGTLGTVSVIGKLYKGVKVGLGLEESTAGKVSGSVILSMNGAGHSSSFIEDLAENATKKILGKGKGLAGVGKADIISKTLNDSKTALAEHIEYIKNGGIVKPTGGKFVPSKVSTAIDTRTGEIYYGYSGKTGFNPSRAEVLSEDLQKLVDNTKDLAKNTVDNPYADRESFELWPVDNCAEINAVDQALKNGAKMEDIFIRTTNFKAGEFADFCDNCKVTFRDFIKATE